MARTRDGYTLAETVLALALAGLLAYAGGTSVARVMPGLQIRSAVWEITAGLNQARFGAIMSGAPVRVSFVPTGFVLERYDEGAAAWRPARTERLDGVTVAANNRPVFQPQGTVSGLASITVANARGTYRITVAITGRIRTTRLA